jgi:hypothetical protein
VRGLIQERYNSVIPPGVQLPAQPFAWRPNVTCRTTPTDPSPTSARPAAPRSVGDEGSPEACDNPPSPSGERPTWDIEDTLRRHRPVEQPDGTVRCFIPNDSSDGELYRNWDRWRAHVASIIAARLSAK